MAKKEYSYKENIQEVIKDIKDRIEKLKSKISIIDQQLLNTEDILQDVKERIDEYDAEQRYTAKSKMIRWFIEDLKVYRELNEIRVDYENLLQKYYDQIINANTKIEEIEIKKAKIESEGSDIREIMERIEESLKKKERAPIIKEIEEEFDEKLRI